MSTQQAELDALKFEMKEALRMARLEGFNAGIDRGVNAARRLQGAMEGEKAKVDYGSTTWDRADAVLKTAHALEAEMERQRHDTYWLEEEGQ